MLGRDHRYYKQHSERGVHHVCCSFVFVVTNNETRKWNLSGNQASKQYILFRDRRELNVLGNNRGVLWSVVAGRSPRTISIWSRWPRAPPPLSWGGMWSGVSQQHPWNGLCGRQSSRAFPFGVNEGIPESAEAVSGGLYLSAELWLNKI